MNRLIRRGLALLAGTLLVGLLQTPQARAESVKLHAILSGASEVPPKTTPGHGTVDASVDTATRMLRYTVTYADLTGPATLAHVHGYADPGVNAGVIIPIVPASPSPLTGTASLTVEQLTNMLAGRTYVNVHTAANPGGEIRGQLVR